MLTYTVFYTYMHTYIYILLDHLFIISYLQPKQLYFAQADRPSTNWPWPSAVTEPWDLQATPIALAPQMAEAY